MLVYGRRLSRLVGGLRREKMYIPPNHVFADFSWDGIALYNVHYMLTIKELRFYFFRVILVQIYPLVFQKDKGFPTCGFF